MSDKLYPVSDADIKALRDKSEDDSNSYSDINKKIISNLKSKTKDGPQMVHFGLDSEDIQYRLGKIKEVAEWAIENGYSKMYVV